MKKEYAISIYLDTRRKKENGLYPVKLRVYESQSKKRKLFPTVFDMSESEFTSTWLSQKPRKEYQDTRLKLIALESHANKEAEKIKPFSIDQFEGKLYRKSGSGKSVLYQYNKVIDRQKKLKRFGTASNYQMSINSLLRYYANDNKKEDNSLTFIQITPHWLEDYEEYMNELGKSRTTVSMYLRALRTVFNIAIENNEIDREVYPFGKGKHKIISVKQVKKALTMDELKYFFELVPKNKEQEKAKDFWFLSYACNGINIKDIAEFNTKNWNKDVITYFRAKTRNTDSELKKITVYLNDFALSIFEKYGTKNKSDYVFDIISENKQPYENFRSIKNFTSFINDNIKRLIKGCDLPVITTYWARHSFATNAVRNGASMEFVSDALNHSDMKTTKSYFAGFEDEAKKEFAQKLMDF